MVEKDTENKKTEITAGQEGIRTKAGKEGAKQILGGKEGTRKQG